MLHCFGGCILRHELKVQVLRLRGQLSLDRQSTESEAVCRWVGSFEDDPDQPFTTFFIRPGRLKAGHCTGRRMELQGQGWP